MPGNQVLRANSCAENGKLASFQEFSLFFGRADGHPDVGFSLGAKHRFHHYEASDIEMADGEAILFRLRQNTSRCIHVRALKDFGIAQRTQSSVWTRYPRPIDFFPRS
jgi:hypothetical protein